MQLHVCKFIATYRSKFYLGILSFVFNFLYIYYISSGSVAVVFKKATWCFTCFCSWYLPETLFHCVTLSLVNNIDTTPQGLLKMLAADSGETSSSFIQRPCQKIIFTLKKLVMKAFTMYFQYTFIQTVTLGPTVIYFSQT